VLQAFQIKQVLKTEQNVYKEQQIEWTPMLFADNSGVLNLLARKPLGILHLLDDEANFPRGTVSN